MTVDLTNVDVYGAYSKHLDLGRKRASTYGGTYWTACPFCGEGTDRFHVWPYRDREDGPTHWCRVCGTCGDVIAFIERIERLDFLEACEVLNIDLGAPAISKPRSKYRSNDDEAPSREWMAMAVKFARICKEVLWSEVGKNALMWLRERGLSDETIRQAGLGYNPATRWDEKESWAIETRQDIRKVWLPRGITIPWRVEGCLWKVGIRRPDPDIKRDIERGIVHSAKYVAVAGGSNGLYGVDDFNYEKPTVILEGEFDKLILSQVVGSDANIFATGSTAKGRGEKWALLVAQSPIVLIAYDADEGGEKAMKDYWLKYLPQSLPWQPWAKDVNAMFLEGMDLKEWLSMGIELAEPATESIPTEVIVDTTEKCHSCQRPFPSFEGWDIEQIPTDDIVAIDPIEGEMYCEKCRPDLFPKIIVISEETLPIQKVSLYLTTSEQILDLASRLIEDCYVLDLETTGLNPRKDKIITLALGTSGNVSIIDLRSFYDASLETQGQWKNALQRLLHRNDITWVGHNLKFDWSFLAVHFGVRLGKVYDTMLVEKLIHNGETGMKYNLLDVAARYDITVTKEQRSWFIDLDQRPLEWGMPLPAEQLAYIEQDIRVPHLLIDRQQGAIGSLGIRRVVDLENNALPMVAAMEVHGITVDVTRWQGILEAKMFRKEALEADIKTVLSTALEDKAEGDTAGKLFSVRPEIDINLGSREQLIAALAALGAHIEDTKAESLMEVKDQHAVVAQLLEWKELEKFISAFGERFLEKVESDGRIHANFNQLGAASGRFSCNSPNLQQIPKPKDDDTDIRRCFIAPTGSKLLVADLSNIELRILAEASGDPMMLRFFAEGKDLHSETARLMFKLGPDVDTKKHIINGVKARDIAKTINFGLAYGMGATGLAGRVGVDLETAKQLMNTYFATYKGVAGYLKQSGRKGTEQGYTVSLSGRRRSFSRTQLTDNKQRGEAERAAKNHPIQGTNADILKRALALLSEQLPENVYVVLTVHDEIVLETPTDNVEIAENTLKRSMMDACREFLKTVAIPEPDVLIADYWVKG